ncbi:putative nucleotidyltransferase substrate binding protein [Clostridium sp. CAG:389]|mgnify:FL=1|nr:putative nucleotidyltransferase substrate binding protein [Clostridium sp. CAG:389]
MKRFEERKEDLKKAANKLNEALIGDASDLEIDGILHRFEFTFELACKTMKDCLEEQGIVGKIGSPREIIKEAFSAGLIDNGEVWMDMMLSRNELSHLYDEETSREIYDNIKEIYILEINKLIQKLDTI